VEPECEICADFKRRGIKFRVVLGVNRDATLRTKHDHAILESFVLTSPKKTLTREEAREFQRWKKRRAEEEGE